MTIQFDGVKFNVYLGSLLYDRCDSEKDARQSICDYMRSKKVGRA